MITTFLFMLVCADDKTELFPNTCNACASKIIHWESVPIVPAGSGIIKRTAITVNEINDRPSRRGWKTPAIGV